MIDNRKYVLYNEKKIRTNVRNIRLRLYSYELHDRYNERKEGTSGMNNTDRRMTNMRSEERIRNNRIRRKMELRRKFLLSIMTVCLVITFSIGINGFLSNAKNSNSRISYKYYTSITVSNEDTLWSIAEKYVDMEHYDSINDYIQEVKTMNHMQNDIITYGEHLIIPYYADAYME